MANQLRTVWTEEPKYQDWKIVPWAWALSEDLSTSVGFILSPRGRDCVLVRNDVPLFEFKAIGAKQNGSLGCDSAVADALEDDTFGVGLDLDADGSELPEDDPVNNLYDTSWSPEEEDPVFPELEQQLAGQEVIDFSDLRIDLSADGSHALFTLEKDGNRYIQLVCGEARGPRITGLLNFGMFSEVGGSYVLSCSTISEEPFWIHNGQAFKGQLHDYEFTKDGAHLVCFCTTEDEQVSIYLDGKVVLLVDKVQNWSMLGDAGSEACCKLRALFDPENRYMLFGAAREKFDGGKRKLTHTLYILELESGDIHDFPGVRILSAVWCTDEDCFKLSILSSADEYRSVKTMSLPHFDPS